MSQIWERLPTFRPAPIFGLAMLLLSVGLSGCGDEQQTGAAGSPLQEEKAATVETPVSSEQPSRPQSASSPLDRLRGIPITPIKKLQSIRDPATAVTRTIYLKGQVVSQAPLLGAQAYQLQDETGSIWVITSSTELSSGDEVLIKGVVQYESIPLAGQEWGELYVEEEQQLERIAAQPSAPRPES